MSKKKFEKFLIRWNNQFPLDRWFRKKYNIAFNSLEHQALNQLDIYFEYLEEKIFLNHEKDVKKKDKELNDYKKGILLKDRTKQEFEEIDEFDLFDKIDLQQFQKHTSTDDKINSKDGEKG